ncbi:Na(+)-translocating NADH-quinone reductase subunit C [Flocculibacter collagenilyticus]|uniref:Na(+)-translocating NADH-quinone reductase subunit C n=1 Tax=Flocculibacter collagenilyticus TaxID=2744479 RepID=UPI0018F3B2CE|nr:Na(+)-translocating NADH-quinone reductase subunit C [Flocculibacter collagenilyticus]
MSSNNDSISKTLIVVISLCLVCAIIVSSAAVALKPIQKENEAKDLQRNVLSAAGVNFAAEGVQATFEKRVEARLVNLDDGTFATEVDPTTFDYEKAKRNGDSIEKKNDVAGIKRRADIAPVYFVKSESGKVDTVVFPVYGKGLWDLMLGFVALEKDLRTIKSIKYYWHKETPGLGGEIENPSWVALWEDKKLFNDQGEFALEIVKGSVSKNDPNAQYKIDGLSGATLTSNGVEQSFEFWMGDHGYGPFINNVRKDLKSGAL